MFNVVYTGALIRSRQSDSNNSSVHEHNKNFNEKKIINYVTGIRVYSMKCPLKINGGEKNEIILECMERGQLLRTNFDIFFLFYQSIMDGAETNL